MSARRSSHKKLSERPSNNALASLAAGISTGAASRPRTTPRKSTADEAIAAKETPYATVRQLANILRPTTPLGHDSSAGPPRLSTRRTHLGQERTPTVPLPNTSSRAPNIVTPHGRAAVRGVELRRANMLTPGNDRRRNGSQQQSETPREPLRALSRILAPRTKPIEPSPQPKPPLAGKVLLTDQDDMEDGRATRPRLSMPLDDDEDDSLLLPPLRSAGEVEDENLTQRSIELPRRASVVEYSGRLSRGSFGSVRTSDQLQDLNEMGLDIVAGDRDDFSFIQQGDSDDYDHESLRRDTIGAPERPYIEDDTRRFSEVFGLTSELRIQLVPEDETETTFILPVPQRDSLLSRQSLMALESSSEEEGDEDGGSGRSQGGEIEHPGYSGITQVGTAEKTRRDSTQIQSKLTSTGRRRGEKIKKRIKVSKYGTQYPSLPAGVVKRLAKTFLSTSAKSSVKLSRDTLDAITLASDWFLEQASDDLGEYAQHAGRKTIDESDVFTLMKRQRQINATTTTPFSLAQKYLPRELVQDIRITQHSKLKRARPLEMAQEEFDEE